VVVGLAVGRRRVARTRARLYDDLDAGVDGTGGSGAVGEDGDGGRNGGGESDTSSASTGRGDDRADLPAPVRRYLDAAVSSGRQPVETARLAQTGEMRLGGPDAPWRPMRATQRVRVAPPGFVWDASVEVAPFVAARVLDASVGGRGYLRAALLGAVPVASAGPGGRMDDAELARYLAEAVWVPTALSFASAGVEWEAVDDRSARATLRHAGASATVRFHFGPDDLVRRVTAERYREASGRKDPWTGYFDAYETVDGLRVPTEAAVEWNLPGGDLPYWRARVHEFAYEPSASVVE
jgi:hypothetical protein